MPIMNQSIRKWLIALSLLIFDEANFSNAQQPKEITNSIGMKLVLIPKGTFQMGSLVSEEGHEKNEHLHEVTISKDYYLGVTEVTQGQYEKVIKTNPSYYQKEKIRKKSSLMYPVEFVSWDDAVAFCKNLSELPEEKKAGRIYRLPTEAEWEYACRAGSTTAYSFGANSKSLGDYAWFADNSGSKKLDSSDLSNWSKNNPREYLDAVTSAGCLPHPVGEKNPNAWGLYDMHGNVLEWCSDFYGAYPEGAVSDPSGPKEGLNRMIRGGSWISDAGKCRSAYRQGNAPGEYYSNIGFRVALSSSGIPKSPEVGK